MTAGAGPRLMVALRVTAAVVCWAEVTGARAQGPLVIDGDQSAYRIVVARAPNLQERYGAGQLQEHVEQISGVRLPLIEDDNAQELVRQHPPGTTRTAQIEDPVDDFTNVPRSVAATRFSGRDQRFDELPLVVREVARVASPFHTTQYRLAKGFSHTSLDLRQRGKEHDMNLAHGSATYWTAVMALAALGVLPAARGPCGAQGASADPGGSHSIAAYGGSLAKALQALGDAETTLCIDEPATVDGDTTVPATLGLVFRKGGRLAHGTHRLRLNGPMDAGPYRIFEGAGEVNLADNAVTELLVEWWGGAADSATDNTPAFAAAVASMTHPTIRLLQGTYLGVFAAQGKIVNLQGRGKSKTILKNNAPEATTIFLGLGHGSFISDLKVDLNGARKTGVLLDGCTYLDMQRVWIYGQGTAGKYALHVTGCTLSSFQDVMISYGAMHVDASYYSHFKNISIAEPRDELPTLHIGSTAALQFYGLCVEHGRQGAIVIEGADNVNFYGIGSEIAEDVEAEAGFIRVVSGMAINFYGGRINQYSNAGWPAFDLQGVRGCTIDGWLLRRSVEGASPFIVLGRGLDNVQVSNVVFYSNPSPAVGVQSAAGAENRAGHVILENLTHGEQPVRHAISAAQLSARNVQGPIENR